MTVNTTRMTHHTVTRAIIIIKDQKGQRLAGNTQETVHVEQRLFVYLKTFEQFIKAKGQGIEYRNLARSGVKIAGVPYLDYENAKKWIESDQVSQIFLTD